MNVELLSHWELAKEKQAEKIGRLHFHLVEIGTMTKGTLSPEFFDCLPPLSELPSEAEQCDSTLRIDPSSFLMGHTVRFPIWKKYQTMIQLDFPVFWDKIMKTETVLVFLGQVLI